MKISKKTITTFTLIIIGVLLTMPNMVLAKAAGEIGICEYKGVLTTFKLAGVSINILKTVLPLIIILTGMFTCFKTVTSGKVDDLKATWMQLGKQIVAGILVFLIPTVIQAIFNNLGPTIDDSSFGACSTCFFDPSSCQDASATDAPGVEGE